MEQYAFKILSRLFMSPDNVGFIFAFCDMLVAIFFDIAFGSAVRPHVRHKRG